MKTILPLVIILLTACSYSVNGKSLSITTGEWQPYVNKQNETEGLATNLLREIFSTDNTDVTWQYQNYELAYFQVVSKEKLASFPYFKTESRASEVLFSVPVFYASSFVYYNRQYQKNIETKQLSNYRIGRVSGYSYGELIDNLLINAKEYVTEKQALTALLNNEIDYLPMTESVMNNMLNNEFSTQKLLITPLEGVKDTASLHLIAANNVEGEQVIKQLNLLINKVSSLSSMRLVPETLKKSPDLAKLVVSEGHPAILGQTLDRENPQYFTLPQGTSILVIDWSTKMITSSNTDSLYKNMMSLSRVLILNGPLVGEELLVRNMHIELL
jgi:polar amino acid transport system substrate-binding protein